MSKLAEIFERKALEVEAAKAAIPLADIKKLAAVGPPVRGFRQTLENSSKPLALIAEIKKASPSKGLIREDFDPAAIAAIYRNAGADCLSVLTDRHFFKGAPENLSLARAASGLPCLRKDFIYDPYQVYEARAWGADCILLIVAGLEPQQIVDLQALAIELGMDVLVEVHSRPEAETALAFAADFIGVNNRNLATFTTSLDISEELIPELAPHALVVSESALETHDDLERVRTAGARAVLIGTAFCAAPDIGAKVREVMAW